MQNRTCKLAYPACLKSYRTDPHAAVNIFKDNNIHGIKLVLVLIMKSIIIDVSIWLIINYISFSKYNKCELLSLSVSYDLES